MSREVWKAVPGYETLYEVSNMGRVKSLRGAGRVLSPKVHHQTGRSAVVLCRDGDRRTFAVARLVLMAFVGPCPDGMECCHCNSDHTDNTLANLRWDTHSANVVDRVNTGAYHPGQKLTPEVVRNILTDPRGYKALARLYAVDTSTIRNIRKGRRWKHLSNPELVGIFTP